MPNGPANPMPGSVATPMRRNFRIEVDDEMRSQGDELALRHVLSEVEDLFRLYAELYPHGRGARIIVEGELRRPGQ